MRERLTTLSKIAARIPRRRPPDAADNPPHPAPTAPSAAIAKWFNNHAAAISITYDTEPNPDSPVDQFVMQHQLTLDYELVTQRCIEQIPPWVKHDLTPLIPHAVPGRNYPQTGHGLTQYAQWLLTQGFGYFGHGHWHVNHDTLSYPQAHDSFRLCYEIMQDLGLNPIAYGYPRGNGRQPRTRQALAAAGFLAGRLAWQPKGHSPYIMPNAHTAPKDWFYLPALQMESYDFRQRQDCINHTADLIPILDHALAQRAWIIPVYHNIGNPAGWSYYHYEHFQDDIQAIAARDFWAASMNDITRYIRQKENAKINLRPTQDHNAVTSIQLTLTQDLDPRRYNHPLTILFTPPPEWAHRQIQITHPHRPIPPNPPGQPTHPNNPPQPPNTPPTQPATIPPTQPPYPISLLPDPQPYTLHPRPDL